MLVALKNIYLKIYTYNKLQIIIYEKYINENYFSI